MRAAVVDTGVDGGVVRYGCGRGRHITVVWRRFKHLQETGVHIACSNEFAFACGGEKCKDTKAGRQAGRQADGQGIRAHIQIERGEGTKGRYWYQEGDASTAAPVLRWHPS